MLIDKPLEWTSFDVVNKLRYRLKHKLGKKNFKVGHSGTLDPMASGLLMICAGKYTKLIDQLSGMDKCYDATIKLGATTPSYDSETEEQDITPIGEITETEIKEVLETFEGPQSQIPPLYSAIKVKGQTAYNLARRGVDLELDARAITIHQISLNKMILPHLHITTCVSKGTYIRSLANDIGKKMKTGGYLSGLVRTSVGEFRNDEALSIDEIIAWIEEVNLLA